MTTGPSIRRLEGDSEALHLAQLMAASEPWKSLGRTEGEAYAIIADPGRDVFVADYGGRAVGFVVIDLRGPLAGYIQSIWVDPAHRGYGLGARLMAWAEEFIGRVSPNVFVCVSSFNPRAQRLYERLGYEVVGRLVDFIVLGHDEVLMRKSAGPWSEFRPPSS